MKKFKPLPVYLPIFVEEIPPASILQFYGGLKLTEFYGNRRYGYPYSPPPFHSAFYCREGLFLNVGAFKTIRALSSEKRSTRRVDVIIVKSIADAAARESVTQAFLDQDDPKIGLNLPTYGIRDYLRFEPWIRWMLPRDKRDFCSEDVTKRFDSKGIKISNKPAYFTAPWDINLYAEARPDEFEFRTLWIGNEFGSKR